MNINYLRNFYVSRVTYLTTPRSAPDPPMNNNYHRPDSWQKWMVWVGLCGNGEVVGPLFFPGNVNGEAYLDMLNNNVVPIWSQHYEVQANGAFRRVWSAQDGAPAHCRIIVCDRLQQLFRNRVIVFGQPREWPPRSPDLTPCDFFCGVSQITHVSNTSTEFGGPPQQNHCRSAFTAAGHGSPSRAEHGNSCSLMHRTKRRTHQKTINLLTFYAIARCVIN